MIKLFKISIYYDGLCPLCSREITHYRKQNGHENFDFIDITSPLFDAPSEGLDPIQVHKVMHVKTAEGELKVGLPAFITIWDHLPKYFWLGRWAKKPLINSILSVGYHAFAFIRPYLPRKKQACENSPYCETRKI